MKKIYLILLILCSAIVTADSFVLQKDKSYFNLTSNQEGIGWGTTFGNVQSYGITFNIYRDNLRQVKIVPNETIKLEQRKFNSIHFKKLKTPIKYNNMTSLESYEIVSTIPDSKIKHYQLMFRVPDKKFTGTTVINNNEIIKITNKQCKNNYCTFTVNGKEQGVFTIAK